MRLSKKPLCNLVYSEISVLKIWQTLLTQSPQSFKNELHRENLYKITF